MTDREIEKRLRGFDKVWQRLENSRQKFTGSARLMPGKDKKSRASRFDPGRR